MIKMNSVIGYLFSINLWRVKKFEFHFQQISLNNTDELAKWHKLSILRLKYKKKYQKQNIP